jgi:P-type E1-E2 ATPase
LVVEANDLDDALASVPKLTDDVEQEHPDSEAAVLSTAPGKKIQRIPVDLLEVGDIVRIPSGSSPPGDGTILQGERSAFDESSLTGESKLVEKQAGDKVHVATINRGNVLHIRIEEIGGATLWAFLP